MEITLDKILAISEKPGLYKMIAQTRNGLLAESLIDGKRIAVNIRNNVSVLSEIAIYTLSEELPIKEVFKRISEKENGEKASVSPKAKADQLEAYLFEVLPDFDEDRVYPSDIKKIIRWYNILQENQLLQIVNDSDEEE